MAVNIQDPVKNLIYARFVDTSKSLIFYQYMDRDADAIDPRYVSFNPDEEECAIVLERFPVEDLEANYYAFVMNQEKLNQNFAHFMEHKEQIEKIIENPEYIDTLEKAKIQLEKFNAMRAAGEFVKKDDIIAAQQIQADAVAEMEIQRAEGEAEPYMPGPDLLKYLQNLHMDKEAFFKIKLAIFEMSQVKDSKDRAWKSAMRKSMTTFELIAALQQGLDDQQSEQDE